MIMKNEKKKILNKNSLNQTNKINPLSNQNYFESNKKALTNNLN